MKINILDWFGLTSNTKNEKEWDVFFENSPTPPFTYPKTTNIPSMQARRMSPPSKLSVEVFCELNKNHCIDAAIFISDSGEITRSYKIIESLGLNTEISPTDFSMSVHNAPSGLATIISQKNIPISSISAGKNGFFDAFYEASTLFSSSIKKILILAYEDEIPLFYKSDTTLDHPAFAIGWIIEQGHQWNISIEKTNNIHEVYSQPLSLEFLKNLLSKQHFSLHNQNKQIWTWDYNNEDKK